MLLNNGLNVDVLGSIKISNSDMMIVKLPNAQYVNNVLVSLILLRPSEFQEYCEKVRKESDDILKNNFDIVYPKNDVEPVEETIVEPITESKEG